MSFNKRTWEGRTGIGLDKYKISTEDFNGKRTIISSPDRIDSYGDAISADNLNDLEDRIEEGIDFASYNKANLEMDNETHSIVTKVYDKNGNLISSGESDLVFLTSNETLDILNS